jgi:hypothetical protein
MHYRPSVLSQKAELRTNLRLCEAAVLLADLFKKLS